MALRASGTKHTSSSGATTPLGCAPRASGPWPLRPIRRARRLKQRAPPSRRVREERFLPLFAADVLGHAHDTQSSVEARFDLARRRS
jgi:hypothetical protein